MINIIFGVFIITGICFSFLCGKYAGIGNQIIFSTKQTLDIIIQIFPLIALWLGIMNIAKCSGLLDKLAKILRPVLKILFPDIPKNDESLGYISSNIIANVFGLGNAATPFGIKAMKRLKELSGNDIASRSMITFLVINTTGFTLIPTTIVSLRLSNGSYDSSIIIKLCIISSTITLLIGLIINCLLGKWFK